MIMLTLLSSPPVFADEHTSTATGGTWATGSTWVGGVAPLSTDSVVIATTGASSVTIGVATTCANLTINNGAILSIGAFSFTSTGTTTVSGTLTVTSTTGTKTFNSVIISGGTWTSTAAETYAITGMTLNSSTFNGSAIGIFNVASGLTVSADTTNTFNAVTITVTGTTTVYGTMVFANTSGTKTFTGGVIISGGTWTSTAAETYAITGMSLSNSTFNGSATGIFNVGANGLAVLADTTNTFNAATLNVSGTTYVEGTIVFASATGTKTFTGLVTINSGGIWNNSGNSAINFRGGVTNNSGTFTAGTGSYTFTTNAQALTGTFSIPSVTVTTITLTNNNTLTVATTLAGTGTLTQGTNATLNFGGASITPTLSATASGNTVNYNGASQTVKATSYYNLNLSGSAAKTTTSVTVNNILSMEGTASASVAPTYGSGATLQYNTSTPRNSGPEWITPFAATGGIIIANTGTITLAAAKAFNAYVPLTIQSGATLSTNASNYSLTFGGNFVNNGGTLSAGSSMIIIAYTATTQSIAGFTTTGLVIMTKTAGTATFTGNVNGGSFTLNGVGGTLDLGEGLTHTFTVSWTRTIGALLGNSSTLIIGGVVTNTAGTFTPGTSTVNYSGTGQNIAPVNYYNLTLSGSGTKNMVNVSNIGGTLTIGNGITLADGGYTLTANGDVSNSGTHSGAGKISLTGGAASHTLSGSGTYGNLEMNDVYGASLTGSPTVSGTLTLTSGNITTNVYILSIGSAGSVSGGNSSSYVIGNLQKSFNTGSGQSFTFPIGDAGNYTPINLVSMTVGTAGSLTANTTATEHPNIDTSEINSSASVNRYWTLTDGGGFASSYEATFNFINPGDIDSGADTGSFIVGNYNGSGWTIPYPTVGINTSTSTQAIGLTLFGDFAIGETVVVVATIEITAPADIPDWALDPVLVLNTAIGNLAVNVNPDSKSWSVTASDTNPTTAGHMTQWYTGNSSYGTVQLATAMNVSGPNGEVTLPSGGPIATGTGDNSSISITFKQTVLWTDKPDITYRIVVTFIGTIN